MFANSAFSGVPSDSSSSQVNQVSRLFWIRYTQARLHAHLAAVRGHQTGLRSLARALRDVSIESRHYVGVRLVALDAIRGSESRSGEFDVAFRPLQQRLYWRWSSVAAAWLAGVVFAPVVLIQVGDDYFVRDGHHRISIAWAMGQRYIDAEVTVWQTTGQPAGQQQKLRDGQPALGPQRPPAFAW